MQVQGMTQLGRPNMPKLKFSHHVFKQDILERYSNVFSKNLESLDFVMQLYKSCFRGHFPIHAK